MISIAKIEDHSDSNGNPSVCGVKSSRTCMLDSLNMSERATVLELSASNELRGRLIAMGLTVGAKVEILHGGRGRFKPLVVGVGESRIAIGRDIARMVLVESDAEGPP